MNWEGIIRQIHPTLYWVIPIFVISTIVFVIVYLKTSEKRKDNEEVNEIKRTVRKVCRWVYFVLMLVMLGVVTLRIYSIVAVSRIPRSEIKRSNIYEQAERIKDQPYVRPDSNSN